MTINQRRAVRKALIDAGFQRPLELQTHIDCTDWGNKGAYSEYWRHSSREAEIVLKWAPKTQQ